MEARDDVATDVNTSGDKGIEDMIKMNNLSEEGILKNLKIRYEKDLIYVRFLISLPLNMTLSVQPPNKSKKIK